MLIAELPMRFRERIEVTDSDCWLWQGYVRREGYVRLWFNGRNQMLHRVTYELLVGPIPDGLQLDHLCRVRSCCNPDHLEPVTRLENVRRGLSGAKEAVKTHCPKGHAYTAENTYLKPPGFRECRTCRRLARPPYVSKKDVSI